MKYRIYALFALLITLPLYAKAQEKFQVSAPPSEVLSTIHNWGVQAADYSKDRPTVVFTSNMYLCSSCCAIAINSAIDMISKSYSPINIIVAIAGDDRRDILALRSNFRSAIVVPDVEKRMYSVLHADPQTTQMFIIQCDGAIVYQHKDLQHQPPSVAVLDSAMANAECAKYFYNQDRSTNPSENYRTSGAIQEKTTKSSVQQIGILNSLIPIPESDTTIISAILSPCVLAEKQVLAFIEPRQQAMYLFHLPTKYLTKVTLPDSIIYYFRPHADTVERWPDGVPDTVDRWEQMSQLVPSMIYYTSIYSTGDSLILLGILRTGYKRTLLENGRKNLRWEKKYCAITITKDHISVDLLGEPDRYLVTHPLLPFDDKSWFALCQWKEVLPETPVVKHIDSLRMFMLYKKNFRQGEAIISYEQLYSDHSGQPVEPEGMDVVLCTNRQGNMYYLNMAKESLIRIYKASEEKFATQKLDIGGSLAEEMRKQKDSIASTVSVGDIGANSSNFYISLIDKSDSRIILQKYSREGVYLGEKFFALPDEKVAEILIAGFDNETMYVVIKGAQKRWMVEKIAIDTF